MGRRWFHRTLPYPRFAYSGKGGYSTSNSLYWHLRIRARRLARGAGTQAAHGEERRVVVEQCEGAVGRLGVGVATWEVEEQAAKECARLHTTQYTHTTQVCRGRTSWRWSAGPPRALSALILSTRLLKALRPRSSGGNSARRCAGGKTSVWWGAPEPAGGLVR